MLLRGCVFFVWFYFCGLCEMKPFMELALICHFAPKMSHESDLESHRLENNPRKKGAKEEAGECNGADIFEIAKIKLKAASGEHL